MSEQAILKEDQGTLTHIDKQKIAIDLRSLIGAGNILDDEAACKPYETDAFTAYREMPLIVALPENTEQVMKIMRYANENGIKLVARGGGTSLSGGAIPDQEGILLAMGKFNKILDIDLENRLAVVEPGVTNLRISQAVAEDGFYYAPDPSSQIACTIGGNVAENAGGVHCLKYGVTANNIVAMEIVSIEGEKISLGSHAMEATGYDLMAVLTGSEGLLGVITSITVKLLPRPMATSALLIGFSTIEDAANCVSSIIARGIIPAGLELMDHKALNVAEDFVGAGYPREAAALLICEADGHETEVENQLTQVEEIATAHHANFLKRAKDEAERLIFWAGRKAAFPAAGRIAQDYYCMDGTIPRHRLAEILGIMEDLSKQYGLDVINVFHAGDGNLHPLTILYNSNTEGDMKKAELFGDDILRACVRLGGVLSGEHGIGLEKKGLMTDMFTDIELKQQQRLKCVFDDQGLLNPGKVFPTLHRCAELGRMHVHKGEVPFPELPRF